MNRIILPAATLALTCALQAQGPLSTETKQAYNNIKNNLTRAAEKMPDDALRFQSIARYPDIRRSDRAHCAVANGDLLGGQRRR